MKIQFANRTYHQKYCCCVDCSFWNPQSALGELIVGCSLPQVKCMKGWKKKLFNDKIFKL